MHFYILLMKQQEISTLNMTNCFIMKLCDKLYIFINLFTSVNTELMLKKKNISLNDKMKFNKCEKVSVSTAIKIKT